MADHFRHGLWFQVYYSSHPFLLCYIRYALLVFITQWSLTALKFLISAFKTPVALAINQSLGLNILLQKFHTSLSHSTQGTVHHTTEVQTEITIGQ